MDEEANDKTDFVTHYDLFWYKRMPFELRNASVTLLRAMDVIISLVKWQFAFVYLDAFVAFSQTPSQYFEKVATVLGLIKSTGLDLKLKEYFLFTDAIAYLAHTIRH